MADILQDHLPYTPWSEAALARMPGVTRLEGDLLVVDSAYAAQIGEKARLLGAHRDQVLAVLPGAEAACARLLETVLARLPAGFERRGARVICPDRRVVDLGAQGPLESLANLIQEDVVLLQKQGDEHVMRAALVCFPASWSLPEKIGHPLRAIHDPVPSYDSEMARRVQRLFDLARPEQPMWRANYLLYRDARLFQPRGMQSPRVPPPGTPPYVRSAYVRSERQTILALDAPGWVAFLIHTYVVPWHRLSAAQRDSFPGLEDR